MQISETEVLGMRATIRSMRNPMNSWSLSDTTEPYDVWGYNDTQLALKLIKAGASHRKFLRFIHVQVDLTLPRYIWTELDTYKVATVRNSCSTMHKLGSWDLDKTDFQDGVVEQATLDRINLLAFFYRKDKSKEVLREMKQLLPEGFLQKATYDCNYETLIKIYFDRRYHRMKEWQTICKWIEGLPMMSAFLKAVTDDANLSQTS